MNLIAASKAIASIVEAACGSGRPPPTQADLPKRGDDAKTSKNCMEKFWITTLHNAFADYYSRAPEVTILSKAHCVSEWRRHEFLHDITVLERRMIPSAYLRKLLPVTRHVLWQVESELSGDGREVAIDFSKLIAGSADSKLLVVRRPVKRQTDGQQRVCRFVEHMAEGCAGNVFLAFLPSYAMSHPHLAYWKAKGPLPVALFAKNTAGAMEQVCTLSPTD